MFKTMIVLGMTAGLLACSSEPRGGTEAELSGRLPATAEDAGAARDATARQAVSDAASPSAVATLVSDASAPSAAYPGTGFVVHEWGTNTVVVSSVGKLLRGMHHEEEDLPAFVYDRLKQGDSLSSPSVAKMETPVDYFYSDKPLTATVSVGMPNGLLTQWYPAVREFAPSIIEGGWGRAEKVDPHLELGLAFDSQRCIDKFTSLAEGRLDWGRVEILARDTAPTPALPDAPLDRFTWSYARDVAANPLRVRNPSARPSGVTTGEAPLGPETERFLFYRGLGNFALPVETVEWDGATDGQGVKLTNRSAWPTQGPVFVLNVGADQGAFRQVDGALAPDAALTAEVTAADTLPIERFVDALDTAMTKALLDTGLYRDEAVAMVRTWRRQWFRTPGVRVLYLAPSAWIDREVPITIAPPPNTLLRVMVIRVELLTRATEDEDLSFVAMLDGGANTLVGERHFYDLGRFAEPRLRRALERLGSVPPAAAALLATIEHPNASVVFE